MGKPQLCENTTSVNPILVKTQQAMMHTDTAKITNNSTV